MKKILILTVLAIVMAMPSFALDINKLQNAMNTVAATSEWINMMMHPGMPKPWTNPQFAQKNLELGENMKIMRSEVNSIETKEEIAKARAVAEAFKMCSGTWRDVGRQLEMMLDEREKFLKIYQ